MNLGQGWKTVLTLFGGGDLMLRIISSANLLEAAFTFYVQTWDEYYTQTLTLGVVSGPVEGILTLCVVYAFTAIMGGGSFWHQSMLQTLGVAKHDLIPDYVYKLPFTDWYMFYGGVVLVMNTVQRLARRPNELWLQN